MQIVAVLLVFFVANGKLQVQEINYGHQLVMCRLAAKAGYEQPAVSRDGVVGVVCVDRRTS